jgi:NADH:ubiquinone reductase (H+-translocating)
MSDTNTKHTVVIVGGGFAGLGCAHRLADEKDVAVTLIDRNNYHQFQPLLYQVATSQLAPSDIANSLREVFADQENVDVKLAEIDSVDVASKTVRSTDGGEWTADALVLAAGSQPNFFNTSGADDYSFPLYSLDDATRLRSRILGLLEQVDRDPSLIERGALNFVIVGGGPTGVEVAGAIADMINVTVPAEYTNVDASEAHIYLVDHGDALLKPFSDKAHDYVARVLKDKGVDVQLETGLKEVYTGHAVFSDGTMVPTRCIVWGGGIMAAEVAANCGLAQGRGGRVDVEPDLTLKDHPGVYAIGDVANIPGPDGVQLPQLGSVALQSGACAAENILADFKGEPRKPFEYHDKGIMAMIGRGAAIAEVGKNHHEVHGEFAHMAWLGVHATLMTGTKAKIEAFVDWAWDGFSKTGGPHVLDRGDEAEIDWDDDDQVPTSAEGSRQS